MSQRLDDYEGLGPRRNPTRPKPRCGLLGAESMTPQNKNRLTVAHKIRLYANFSCPKGKSYGEGFTCQETDVTCKFTKDCFWSHLSDLNAYCQASERLKEPEVHRPPCSSCANYRQPTCTFYSLRDVIEPTDEGCCDFQTYSRKRLLR